MIIREATGKDVFDLKELYFVYLTKWPPKEEQNMEQWAQMLEDFRKKDSFYIQHNRVGLGLNLCFIFLLWKMKVKLYLRFS